jgi:hypothetical protein
MYLIEHNFASLTLYLSSQLLSLLLILVVALFFGVRKNVVPLIVRFQ